MKFDKVTRFCEMNSTVKSVSSSESRKVPVFNQNYCFTIFFRKIDFFSAFIGEPKLKLGNTQFAGFKTKI